MRRLVVLCFLGLAVSAPAAQADVLDDVNSFRSRSGLAPLRLVEDQLADEVLHRVIREGRDYRTGGSLYRRSGGKRPLAYVIGLLQGGRPAAEDWPELLDPRARELVRFSWIDGFVAVRLPTARRWRKPRVIGKHRVNLAARGGLRGLLLPGPAHGKLKLSRRLGSRWAPARSQKFSGFARGFGGSMFLPIAGTDKTDRRGLRLSFGSRYRVTSGGESTTLSTQRWRAPHGTFLFGSRLQSRYRKIFLRNLRRSNAQARHIIYALDGMIYVAAAPRGSKVSQAVFGPVGGRSAGIFLLRKHLLLPGGLSAHVSLHEFGHIVYHAGLDEYALQEFRAAFRRSPRWRNCFRSSLAGQRCTPFAEVWADQFAYFATGNLRPRSGYNDPPLLSRASFGHLLARHWAFRVPR